MRKRTVAVLSFILGGFITSVLFIAVLIWFGNTTNYSTAFTVDKPWTEELNKYRSQNNMQPVQEDYYLNTLADAKCDDMVQRQYYAHEDPEGNSVADLSLSKFNTQLGIWGENIAQGSVYSSSETMLNWYNSEGHRKNMLNPDFTRVGHAKCFSGGGYTTVEVLSNE